MTIRLPLFLAIVFGWGAGEVFAQATSVTVQLFPFTGEVRLVNENPTDLTFALYSLQSPSGAFNPSPAAWKSISDTYDVSGNQFIDSVNDWLKLDATEFKLTEAVFPPTSIGTLLHERAISLGIIWDPDAAPSPDVTAMVQLADGSNADVDVRRVVDGDFNSSRTVEAGDYALWKGFYGSTSAFFADGNINGVVDAADYTLWRDNLGSVLPIGGDEELGAGGALAAVGVPEPATSILACAAVGGWLLRRSRRRG